jgi:hypothetical protein
MKPTTQSFKKFRIMRVVMPLLALVFADLIVWAVDWFLLIYKGK